MKVECVKRLVNCPNLSQGCLETVPLDEVDEHVLKSCRKRVVECRLDCGLRFACDRRHEHEVRMLVCVCSLGDVHAYLRACVCFHACVCFRVPVLACVCVFVCVCVRKHARTHTHAHTRMCALCCLKCVFLCILVIIVALT